MEVNIVPGEASRPPSQEEILDAALASLTEHDVPPDEECWGWPDPDTGPPAELADLTVEELEELAAEVPPPTAGIGPAGFVPPNGSGCGSGFADGGVLDLLIPGVALAGFADDAHARLPGLTDDELIGVLRAWRRQESWAQARELAVVAELARRRPAEDAPAPADGEFPEQLSEFLAAEIAVALTMTGVAAGRQLDLALDLAERPATAASLESGQIDLPRARIIIEGVAVLAGDHAAAVEDAVLPRAPEMTTGQLRAAVARAVLAADPQAARQRREEAQQHARVECWSDPEGTANLVGRCLPPAEVLAADKRLCQVAASWKKQGAIAGMDMLRARAYLALLNGLDINTPPADLLPPAGGPAAGNRRSAPGRDPGYPNTPGVDPGHPTTPGTGSPAGHDSLPGANRLVGTDCPASTSGPQVGQVPLGPRSPGQAGVELPPLAGSVHLTLPLATLLGLSDMPGEADRLGPLDGWTARDLARAAAAHPRAEWHLIITGPDGRAIGHGSGVRRRLEAGEQWTFTLSTEPITRTRCDHRNEEPGYRPSPRLRHLIEIRSSRCTFPGCRRSAYRCDHDHTVRYDDGGRTCECNLAPLCRFHHRLKHSQSWALEQPSPGVMAWITPAGRHLVTNPTQHPI
jgi:hypothetical protein